MSEIYKFPGAFVFKHRLPNHEEIKSRILPKIIEHAEAHKGDPSWGWSVQEKAGPLSNWAVKDDIWAYFDEATIRAIAFDPVLELMRSGTGGAIATNYSVKDIWWNRYPPGSSAPPHVHDGNLSGVYFLEQTEECPLRFFYRNEHSIHPYSELGADYNPKGEEGDVILFPPSMLHYVKSTEAYRATVSFNLAG